MIPVYRVQQETPYPTEVIALRWYVQDKWLRGADENMINYRNWIFGIKNAKPKAVEFFIKIFLDYWGGCLGPSTLLVTIPSGRLHPGTRGAGLRSLARQVATTTNSMYSEQGLRRILEASQKGSTNNLPNRHSTEFQSCSLSLGAQPSKLTKRLIVIDDIITTGATMHGAIKRLIEDGWKNNPGELEIFGFAFGRTLEKPSVEFPAVPQFTIPPWISKP